MATRKEKTAPTFIHLNNVASMQNGAQILFATDDFFALAENLIKDEEPIWKENEYTEFGKWMDGWETRRKRIPGHDFCLIQLACPATITGVEINTAYFTGNHAPRVSIQACDAGLLIPKRTPILGAAAGSNFIESLSFTQDWEEILPMTSLQPGYADTCRNWFPIQSVKTWRTIRFNLYPDGGVARLRVFGHVKNTKLDNELDLIAFENGGEIVAYSDAHFGHPRNLLKPGRGLSMADGWETARRLDRPPILKRTIEGDTEYEGSEWCIIKMGAPGNIEKIEIDTNHFKGNCPDRVKIEGCVIAENNSEGWVEILPYQKLKPNNQHFFNVELKAVLTRIRLTVVPDGGISRLRIIGSVQK